ncbi:MAG: ATP-binding protein [Meiothermus ruber]|jgi:replication-associated recombination protein RarA|uniref:ATP-binding protein n=1 Tax=Meiothermus ruber TaxID=277 RepID=UPI0005681566|nr:ATP-binding protein [Meiothermus ruber]MCL6529736.1 ATP-binding protein [Meiothermus ruber]MCX7802356.1 ATP-binding protein [Meiothermus ruber]
MARLETTNTQAAFIASIRPRLKSVVLKRAGLALALSGEPGVGKTHLAQQLLWETPCRSFSFHALMRGFVEPVASSWSGLWKKSK